MATLWIREFGSIADAGNNSGKIDAAQEPGTDQTPVTFSTSAQSAAFAAGTEYVTIVGSVDFHYVVGTNPTATTSALRIPAYQPWTIGVTAGHKIAAIAA